MAATTAYAQFLPAQPDISSVIFVDADAVGANDGSSWVDAFTDLQDALAAASHHPDDGEVWVAEGTYHPAPPSGRRYDSFELANNVSVYGGFSGGETQREQRDRVHNITILSGDLNENDTPGFGNTGENSYHVVATHSSCGFAVLDGFTITGGNANRWYSTENGRGGGIHSVDGSVTVRGCIIEDNYAKIGAGVYNDGAELSFVNCEFSSNHVWDDSTPWDVDSGGGLHMNTGAVVLDACEFYDNSATTYGGAVFVSAGTLVANGCTFVENDAGSGGGVYGGADGVFHNCSFASNQADADGGAIGGSWSNASLRDCVFSGNIAGGHGGAIYGHATTLGMVNCVITGNTAGGHGGAIYDYEATLRLVNCVVTGNTADKGGAIWNSHSLFMTNCLVAANSAPSDWGAGGGLYTQLEADPGHTLIANCTIAGNGASNGYGGGVFAGNSSEAFVNCIIWGNFDLGGADESAQIHRTTDLINIDYCGVQGLSGALGGIGNVGGDPGFVDIGHWDDGGTPGYPGDDVWVLGDYRLTAGSPCIDAGDNTAVPADLGDLDADGDVDERVPLDLAGAFRFVDDPLASDVGVADPPDYPEIVDMGAYEYGSCVGDLDGDGGIGLGDLVVLLAHYGTADAGYENGDLDRDGDTGLSDLAALLAVYGASCR